MGWYTTRWVEADTQAEAEARAVDQLRTDPALALTPKGSGASISFEEIDIVDEGDVPEELPGFTFFPMD